jgi:hypothetical protein
MSDDTTTVAEMQQWHRMKSQMWGGYACHDRSEGVEADGHIGMLRWRALDRAPRYGVSAPMNAAPCL